MLKKNDRPLRNAEEKAQFAAFYERFEHLMYRTAAKVINDPTRAEDLVHDCLPSLISNAQVLLALSVHQQAVYVRTTIIRAAVQQRKRFSREDLLPDFEHPENPDTYIAPEFYIDDSSIEEDLMRKFDHDRLHQAISLLRPLDEQLITLTYFLYMDSPDVGKVLNMSTGAVRMALTRARRKLKEIYCNMD